MVVFYLPRCRPKYKCWFCHYSQL